MDTGYQKVNVHPSSVRQHGKPHYGDGGPRGQEGGDGGAVVLCLVMRGIWGADMAGLHGAGLFSQH